MGIFSSLFSRRPAGDFSISEREVLVRGSNDSELKQILTDFKTKYCDRLPSNFITEFSTSNNGFTHISFPQDVEPRFYCWLINYIQYPERFDLPSRTIVLAGRATITSDFLPSDHSLIGKRMLFYIPTNDTRYDEVFGRADNQSYEFPFSSERWRKVADPRLPKGLNEIE